MLVLMLVFVLVLLLLLLVLMVVMVVVVGVVTAVLGGQRGRFLGERRSKRGGRGQQGLLHQWRLFT